MALIVEDGTGKVDADCYSSYDEYVTYWTKRGNATAAALSQATVEANKVKAAAYMNARYRGYFKGRKLTKEQSMVWPRIGATIEGDGTSYYSGMGTVADGFYINDNEIPQLVKDAENELTWRANSADLAPDIAPNSVLVTKKKVGPIEIDYSDNTPVAPSTVWRYVDMLLSPLLRSSGMVVEIVRS